MTEKPNKVVEKQLDKIIADRVDKEENESGGKDGSK